MTLNPPIYPEFAGGTVPNPTTFGDTVTISPPAGHNYLNMGTAFFQDSASTTLFITPPTSGRSAILMQAFDTQTQRVFALVDVASATLWEVGPDGELTCTPRNSKVGVTTKGIKDNFITSGALPTQAFASGTAAQVSTLRDVETHTPVTFNPTAGATATCKVELSPDNVTYSTLGIETEPVGVTFDGTIHVIQVRVPAAWYLKFTVTNATLGTTTYY